MSDRIEEIRGRLGAATPGPWRLGWPADDYWVAFIDTRGDGGDEGYAVTAATWGDRNADAQLIAHAPEDISYLCERLEVLQIAVWTHLSRNNAATYYRLLDALRGELERSDLGDDA